MFRLVRYLDDLLFTYIFQPLLDWRHWHPTQAANGSLIGSSVFMLTSAALAFVNARYGYPLIFVITVVVTTLIVNPIIYRQNSSLGRDLNTSTAGNVMRRRQMLLRVSLSIFFFVMLVFTSNFVFSPVGTFFSIGYALFIAQLYFAACEVPARKL